MTKSFYRTSDVLALLGISRSTLNLWVSLGKFPKPRKFGQRLNFWNSSDVDAWIDPPNSVERQGGEV